MSHAKYQSCSPCGSGEEDTLIFLLLFRLVAMATMLLYGINFFEQHLKLFAQGTILLGLVEIGLVAFDKIF